MGIAATIDIRAIAERSRRLAARACESPWLLVGLGLLLAVAGTFNHDVWTSDEPRVAGIGREMWLSGSWWIPRLNGVPFLEKPPFYWWVQSVLFTVFGHTSAGIARMASALLCLGALGLTYALGRVWFGRRAARLAGLVLLTTSVFAQRSHWIAVDPGLLLGITGSMLCFACAEHARGTVRAAWLGGLTVFVSIGFFSKGLVGVGTPYLAILSYLACSKKMREFAVGLLLSGSAVGLVALLWLYRVGDQLGAHGLQQFLMTNQLSRFAGVLFDAPVPHERPIYYYLVQAPLQLLPWFPLAVAGSIAAVRHWARIPEAERAGLRGVACMLIPNLIVLSLANSKRPLYVLPLAPFEALLIGWWLAASLPQSVLGLRLETAWRRFVLAGVVVAPAAVVALDPKNWPWLAAIPCLAALFVASERRPSGVLAVRWSRTLAITAIAVSIGLASIPRAVDPLKSLRPATEAIDRMVPAGTTLCAVNPSETLLGLLSFYTKRTVDGGLCTTSPERLYRLSMQAAGRPLWLITESRSTGISPVVLEHLKDAGLSYALEAQVGNQDRQFHLLKLDLPPGVPVATRE